MATAPRDMGSMAMKLVGADVVPWLPKHAHDMPKTCGRTITAKERTVSNGLFLSARRGR